MTVATRHPSKEERQRGTAFLASVMERAAAIGHVLEQDLARVKVSGNRYGYATRCSCGWEGTPKSKRFPAFREGFGHLGDVLGLDARDTLSEALSRSVGAVH